MKLYKAKQGIVLEKDTSYYLVGGQSWDTYVNDDQIYSNKWQGQALYHQVILP